MWEYSPASVANSRWPSPNCVCVVASCHRVFLASRTCPSSLCSEPGYRVGISPTAVPPFAQTNWAGPVMTDANWRPEVRGRLATLNWAAARADVRPFLEHERDLQLVSPEALEQLLGPGR